MASAPRSNGDFERWQVNHQGQRRRALCTIVVNGQDVTRAIDPHLLSVQTVARRGLATEADEAIIELDDREGRLAIPPPKADLEVWLGWMGEAMGLTWTGFIEDVESGFSRRGGARRLWLQAKGFDGLALKKAHFRIAWGDGEAREIPLEEVLTQAGTAAGLSVKISPSMRNISRKYWAQNESFLNFGWRLARELGGNFKVAGNVATMVHATDGQNVDGDQMGTVIAEWGINLLQWRIKPFATAPQAQQASSVTYNKETGNWETLRRNIESDLPFVSQSVTSLPGPAPNRVTADQWNVALENSVLTKRGVGSIVINGEPSAMVGGKVDIKGARAGVDGTYGIDEVEHVYSRAGGFTTTITCKFPELDSGPFVAWDWVKPPPKPPEVNEPEQH